MLKFYHLLQFSNTAASTIVTDDVTN